MTSPTKPVPVAAWPDVFRLFPGRVKELADRLDLTTQGLHNLRTMQHASPPHWLLQRLARILAKGTADGSPAPTQQRLTMLWRLAKDETDIASDPRA